MKYIYLVNRFHLGNKTDEVIRRLQEASEELGRDYAIDVCETVEEAQGVSEKYKDTEYIITAVGGDGTIHYLVNALAGTGNILSFVPYGTGNDFFHTCMDTLDDGIHEVDIVRVNDRYYINTICFGVDADIANDERFIHNRLIPRQLRFHAAAVYHFLTHKKGRRLKIRLEGAATGEEGEIAEKACGAAQHESRAGKKSSRTIKKECVTVVAANGRYYGGGYQVSPDSRINDGLLELYIVDQMDRFRMARLILSIKNGRHLHHPALRRMQIKKAVISAPRPFRANIDGEPLLSDRFALEVIPHGIRLAFDREFIDRFRS